MKQKDGHWLALGIVILAAILTGGVTPFVKIGLTNVPPFTYTFIRFFIAAFFIGGLLLREKPRLTKHVWQLVPVSLLSTANIILFSLGIRYIRATASQILYSTVPIITFILSYFIIREKFTVKKLLGVALGFTGINVVVFLSNQNNAARSESFIGYLLIIIGVITYSFYGVVSKHYQKNYSPIVMTTFFILTTMLFSLFFSVWELATSGWPEFSRMALISILYVSIVGTFIAYLLQQYAIKYGSPLIASISLYLQPITTFLWAAILLGEKLTVNLVLGAVLILTGAFLTALKK